MSNYVDVDEAMANAVERLEHAERLSPDARTQVEIANAWIYYAINYHGILYDRRKELADATEAEE